MKTKNLMVLAGAAVVLGAAALLTGKGGRIASSPALNGTKVLPKLAVADVARIEIGGPKKLTLAAGEKGWTIDAWFGYPADVTKIRENLLKLADLKVGQVANGRKLTTEIPEARFVIVNPRQRAAKLHSFNPESCRQKSSTNSLSCAGRQTSSEILRHPVHPHFAHQFAGSGKSDIQQYQFKQTQTAVIPQFNAIQRGDAIN